MLFRSRTRNGLGDRDSRGKRRGRCAEMPEKIAVSSLSDRVRESGWEAGIRTPIPWSRATCPTVGRPPTTSRGAAKGTEFSIIVARKLERQALGPVSGNGRESAHLRRPSSAHRRPCRTTDYPVASACGGGSPSRPSAACAALLVGPNRGPAARHFVRTTKHKWVVGLNLRAALLADWHAP